MTPASAWRSTAQPVAGAADRRVVGQHLTGDADTERRRHEHDEDDLRALPGAPLRSGDQEQVARRGSPGPQGDLSFGHGFNGAHDRSGRKGASPRPEVVPPEGRSGALPPGRARLLLCRSSSIS